MRALSTALYAVMAADAPLKALLGTYKTAPSIFTERPVPSEAKRPLVLAATVVSDTDADFVSSERRAIERDIAVYGDANGSILVPGGDYRRVVEAAERIRALFHRRPLTIPGFHVIDVRARGPIDAPADPQEIGRIVTLSIRLQPR